MQPAQIAARGGFDDGARAGHVAFERRFEFFDRVQPRFGAGEIAGDRRDSAPAASATRVCGGIAARTLGRRQLALLRGASAS